MSRHKFDDMTEPELRRLFNRVAAAVDKTLPKGTGFIVLAAPIGRAGVAQFVSNVHREDAIQWMQETIDRFESGDFVGQGPT